MTTAIEYNALQIQGGALSSAHVTELVVFWQASHALTVDGKAGPNTIASIEAALRPAPFLRCPLPILPDERQAQITSSFRPADRPTHDGVDWFYVWRKGDQPSFTGDKGAAGIDAAGYPRWVVPYGTRAIAAAPGRVVLAGPSATGYRVWVDHGNGLRTGYFHLLGLDVAVGDVIVLGAPIGEVGDNPNDNDGRHLHFELSPVDRYSPMDPEPYLIR